MAVRHTPYHQKFVELGAELADRIGFEVALSFTSTEEEHLATRNQAGLYDVYYQGPIDIKGPDSLALLQRVLVRDVERRLADDGRVVYSSLCNESGGMIDDLTAYRLTPEHFWLVATPSRVEVVAGHLTEQARGMRTYVTNTVSGHAYLSVQGPKSREILSGLTEADLSTDALPYYRFVDTTVAEIPAVLSRTGYSGELGYELYYARDYAHHVWDTLVGTGAVPCGLGALRSTRMEKKYPLYGLDVDDATSPLEASLGWAVDLDKPGGFIGRDSIARQRDEGLPRRLFGIEFPDLSYMPAAGDAVNLEGKQAGTVTSSDRGYSLGKALAMAYLPPDSAGAGVEVTSGGGAGGSGTVVDRPFYDPEGLRLRS